MATLADPFSIHGVRIPDATTQVSATATLRDRFTVSPIQDGTTGNYMAGLVYYFTANGSYSTWSAYNSTLKQATPSGASGTMLGLTTLTSLARAYRVVSGGIAIYSTTAMAKNSGRNICVYYPGADKLGNQLGVGNPASFANFLAAENNSDTPLNKEMICSIKWAPSDESNYDYHPVNSGINQSVGTNLYYNPGTAVWISDGVDSSALFEVCVTLNIEYLPGSAVIGFVDCQPSQYNTRAMERALNSPVVRNMFHDVDPSSVFSSTANDDVGLSNTAGSILNTFGSGVGDFLRPYSYKFGQAIARASLGWAAKRSYDSVRSLNAGLYGLTMGQ
jgi:hypothetical protein